MIIFPFLCLILKDFNFIEFGREKSLGNCFILSVPDKDHPFVEIFNETFKKLCYHYSFQINILKRAPSLEVYRNEKLFKPFYPIKSTQMLLLIINSFTYGLDYQISDMNEFAIACQYFDFAIIGTPSMMNEIKFHYQSLRPAKRTVIIIPITIQIFKGFNASNMLIYNRALNLFTSDLHDTTLSRFLQYSFQFTTFSDLAQIKGTVLVVLHPEVVKLFRFEDSHKVPNLKIMCRILQNEDSDIFLQKLNIKENATFALINMNQNILYIGQLFDNADNNFVDKIDFNMPATQGTSANIDTEDFVDDQFSESTNIFDKIGFNRGKWWIPKNFSLQFLKDANMGLETELDENDMKTMTDTETLLNLLTKSAGSNVFNQPTPKHWKNLENFTKGLVKTNNRFTLISYNATLSRGK